MRQTLVWIPYEVGGVPIFGVGLLLAVCLVWAAVVLILEARRHSLSSETPGRLLPLAMMAAAVWGLPRLFPGGLPIRGYGVMVLAGALAGLGLAVHRGRQLGLPAERVTSMAFWLLLSGIIGARIFHVVEYWDIDYWQPSAWETFKAVINVPQGGLVVYGALFGAVVGFVLYIRWHGLPALAMADLLAPSMAIGLALGRVGCFLNGCCYGGLSDAPWAVTFPAGSPPYEAQVRQGMMYGFALDANRSAKPQVLRVLGGSAAAVRGLEPGERLVAINGRKVATAGGVHDALVRSYRARVPLVITAADGRRIEFPAAEIRPRSLPVHPTQLYSAVAALLLGFFLWAYYPFRRRDGQVIALLLSIYPVVRIVLEAIRQDEPAQWGTGLTISQNVSLLLLAAVVGLWVYILRQPPGMALPAKDRSAAAPPRGLGQKSHVAS